MKHFHSLVNRHSTYLIDFVNWTGETYVTIEMKYESSYRRLLTALGRSPSDVFEHCTASEQDVLMAFSAWFCEWAKSGFTPDLSRSPNRIAHLNSQFVYANLKTGIIVTFTGYFNEGFGHLAGLPEDILPLC